MKWKDLDFGVCFITLRLSSKVTKAIFMVLDTTGRKPVPRTLSPGSPEKKLSPFPPLVFHLPPCARFWEVNILHSSPNLIQFRKQKDF